jgi:hypothetical protein
VKQTSDRLTHRERMLYKYLHGLGLAWAASWMIWFFVISRSAPSYTEAVVFSFGCLLVPVFALALRNDIRIIYGISWLREH